MTDPVIRFRVTRCALVCLMMCISLPTAEGGFTVSINGTQVASDNGVGDHDIDSGVIRYIGKIDGYQIRLTASTEITALSSHLTTTELRIMNSTSGRKQSIPLVVTILETFSQPPGYRGEMSLTNTLTRNTVAGLDTSGVVSSTTSGLSTGGVQGTTGELVLTDAVAAGTSSGTFERTEEEYNLSQTLTINGLLGGRKVVVTAGSGAGLEIGSSLELVTAPAPPALALLAVGLALVGVYQLRSNQWRLRI